ncbi:MAG: hypothetical protein ACO31D_04835 [Ilumatobacteraceae bacterium]
MTAWRLVTKSRIVVCIRMRFGGSMLLEMSPVDFSPESQNVLYVHGFVQEMPGDSLEIQLTLWNCCHVSRKRYSLATNSSLLTHHMQCSNSAVRVRVDMHSDKHFISLGVRCMSFVTLSSGH